MVVLLIIIVINEYGGVCSTHRRYEKLIFFLVVKPEGARPFRRPIYGWVDNIKLDLI
jgi:hypothetical protein